MSMSDSPEIEGGAHQELFDDIRTAYLQARPPTQILSIRKLLFSDDREGDESSRRRRLGEIYAKTVGRGVDEPPIQYRITFTKYIIKEWEKNETLQGSSTDGTEEDKEDLISAWYEALERLGGLNPQTEPFYRLYELIEGQPPLKIFENEGAFVAEGTTGLVTWEASLELAKWLISFKETGPKEGYGWRDIRWILELGCGCGFLAVAGLKIFPAPTVVQKYIATDGSFTALERCRENVSANFTDTTETNAVQFEELDWDSDAEKLRKLVEVNTEKYGRGLLLGADVVFDPSVNPFLINLLNIFQENQSRLPEPGISVLSCTVRNEATVEALIKDLENKEHRKTRQLSAWGNGIILEVS